MKKQYVLSALIFLAGMQLMAQPRKNIIRQMKWGLESTITLTMANDSVYAIQVDDVFQTDLNASSPADETVYFPANLTYEYVEKCKNTAIDKDDERSLVNIYQAVHSVTGGSYAHFLNLLLYVLQTYQLDLRSPEMLRPVTKWKPSPVTESYLRTRRWKYYVPVEYKNAKREYEYRKKHDKMAELDGIPMAYIRRSNRINDKKYAKLSALGYNDMIAEIDLVRLMLGANFLGKEQIRYIRDCVLRAVNEYKIYELPSLVIFTNYKAAVAISLDVTGYRIEGIVFSDEDKIDQQEKDRRTNEIRRIIDNVNQANQRAIERRIKKLYD